MRFDFTITHVPGKELHTADTLSRAPLSRVDDPLRKEVHAYVQMIVTGLPASEERLENIREQQENDSECSQLKELCERGKLTWDTMRGTLKPYYPVRDELNVVNGILMRGQRMVIPTALRELMLSKLHSVHQGVTKCKERANQSVWWPGIRKNIEEVVYRCLTCCKHKKQRPEPLIPSEFPAYPWQVVATDLFEKKGVDYLLVVDYYSRYVEVTKLPRNKTAETTVTCLKSIFARHGIPEKVISDNGPQYASETFKSFAAAYGFKHVTSSPRYPQSNGAAERAVKTVKTMFEKNEDPYMALLILRSTPLENGFSPAELLMNRKVRTTLPIAEEQLLPSVPDRDLVRKKEEEAKQKMKKNFDRRHQVVSLPTLQTGDKVWVPEFETSGTVIEETHPRSYRVQLPTGILRRNRRHLISLPEGDESPPEQPIEDAESQSTRESGNNTETEVTTRSGRVSKPPDRLMTVFVH